MMGVNLLFLPATCRLPPLARIGPKSYRVQFGHIQNTTIYARLTTATLDTEARKIFASHRVM